MSSQLGVPDDLRNEKNCPSLLQSRVGKIESLHLGADACLSGRGILPTEEGGNVPIPADGRFIRNDRERPAAWFRRL